MTTEHSKIQPENPLSYREKNLIAITTLMVIVYCIYSIVLFRLYQGGSYEAADAFQFWGKAILVLIGVVIMAQIVGQILHAVAANVVAAAAGQEFDEDEAFFNDERDKLIELKATQNTFAFWGVGFLGAMIALAVGRPPATMFILFIVFMMLADILGNVSRFIYYRRGF